MQARSSEDTSWRRLESLVLLPVEEPQYGAVCEVDHGGGMEEHPVKEDLVDS